MHLYHPNTFCYCNISDPQKTYICVFFFRRVKNANGNIYFCCFEKNARHFSHQHTYICIGQFYSIKIEKKILFEIQIQNVKRYNLQVPRPPRTPSMQLQIGALQKRT